MTRDKTCKERVREAYASRIGDIKKLYAAGYGVEVPELGKLEEYGLSIDRVPAHTFKDQDQGYRRYQLSWGGPSEEFRLYTYGRMEFWFLDWFDGACVEVKGRDKTMIANIIKHAL